MSEVHVEAGMFNHEDGSKDHAIASPETDGDGLKVTYFPEQGGVYAVAHNVPRGSSGGQFSAS